MIIIKRLNLVIVLALIGLLIFIVNNNLNGQFRLQYLNSIYPSNKDIVYLGYEAQWDKALVPAIKDIKFTTNSGKVIQELENEKDALIFIDNSNHIGSAREEDIDPRLLTSFKNYRLKDKNLNLVFKVDPSYERLKEVGGIMIEYSILGVKRYAIFKIKFFR